MSSVLILLSTYNGAEYLCQLLDSVFAQENADVSVLARDDGSTDGSVKILNEYARVKKLSILEAGPNLGYARSFWRLLKAAAGADYYAFADQDDVWLSGKLKNAIDRLGDCAKPSLCTSNVLPVDGDLRELAIEPFPVHGPLSLAESLQKSILPGCTFVFNDQARALAARYNGYMESHDWALYAIITALGQVRYCETPGIKYRIHGGNAVGVSSGSTLLRLKVKRLFSPSTRSRSRFASDLLNDFGMDMDSSTKRVVALLANYRDSPADRVALACSREFKGVAFRCYSLLGRL